MAETVKTWKYRFEERGTGNLCAVFFPAACPDDTTKQRVYNSGSMQKVLSEFEKTDEWKHSMDKDLMQQALDGLPAADPL